METSGNIRTKRLIFSARQRTYSLVVGFQKIPCEAQCGGFGPSTIFLGLVTIRLVHVSHVKRVLKGRFANVSKVAAKATRALTVIEKWFQGELLKALGTLAKLCCCQICCVNRCELTYFCVIDQLRERFKASNTYNKM
jgi:hypothetical protein